MTIHSPDRNNSKGEGLILAHGFGNISIYHGGEGMAAFMGPRVCGRGFFAWHKLANREQKTRNRARSLPLETSFYLYPTPRKDSRAFKIMLWALASILPLLNLE